MTSPRVWTLEELAEDVAQARSVFRDERIEEPLELYSEFFDTFRTVFADLVPNLNQIIHSDDPDAIAEVMKDADKKTAFRYLTAPPISEDDLKVLADTKLSSTALKSDPQSAARIREIVLHIIDPHRFGWVTEKRAPSDEEQVVSVVASAAMVAARKVETSRRNNAKDVQEQAVKSLLLDLGFQSVERRTIKLPADAPGPGEYCGESILGDTRADLIIGLHDRRVLAIECKASNSEVNSFKRVNHEALGKAQKWLAGFGKNATVPGAVLSGVFSVNNLDTAQSGGLNIFWSHRLDDLAKFIEATK